MTSGGEDVVGEVISSAVADADFDLEDLRVRRTQGRYEVRVVIDRDGGVGLDVAAALSRHIARELDARGDDVFGGSPYTLEVTSPGADRPLTKARHFRRAADRLVTITDVHGREEQCRVVRVEHTRVLVLAGPTLDAPRLIPLDRIDHAVVDVEFSRPSASTCALLSELRSSPEGSVGEHTSTRENGTARNGATAQGEDAR